MIDTLGFAGYMQMDATSMFIDTYLSYHEYQKVELCPYSLSKKDLLDFYFD